LQTSDHHLFCVFAAADAFTVAFLLFVEYLIIIIIIISILIITTQRQQREKGIGPCEQRAF